MQNLITTAKAVTRARRDEDARKDEGFTLIELLVVVAVIGILAGIVVFGVAGFKKDATDGACQAASATVQTAADAYLATHAGTTVAYSVLVAGNYVKTETFLAGCALPANVTAG